ncbi:MAG: potassium-transporting ATPase subunit KdpC [Bacillota bacterium]
MLKELRPAILLFIVFTVILGFLYPLAVTGAAQAAFPTEANGSLIKVGGHTMGSAIIGQEFSDPKYFWGRISATSPYPYNGDGSTGSNLGPTNPALFDQMKARIAALKAADPDQKGPFPVDLVTASGSGLDPDISPAAAEYQVARVAKARHMSEAEVRALVQQHTADRQLGFLGEPRVNVLELNLALDGVNP